LPVVQASIEILEGPSCQASNKESVDLEEANLMEMKLASFEVQGLDSRRSEEARLRAEPSCLFVYTSFEQGREICEQQSEFHGG
jgi:hypothetical protein